MNGIRNTIIITIGEPVTASPHAEEFNLTANKEYIVKGYDGDCIKIQNDIGNDEWYSLDYFYEFDGRFDI